MASEAENPFFKTSSPTSSASSTTASPHTRPVANNVTVPSMDNLKSQVSTPPLEPQAKLVVPPVQKPTMAKRLTRMFSVRGDPSRSSQDGSVDSGASAHNSDNEKRSASNGVRSSVSRTESQRPGAPVRTDSSSEKPTAAKSKPKDGGHVSQRFVIDPDVQGGHEHHLKSAKRQEKLSDMLSHVLGGGKKKDKEHEGEQLSLMSSWVDQLKKERDTLATDKKGGPNATATLVEKYGKCQEIVGRGAFGIVRISHKKAEGPNQHETLFAVKEFRRRPDENEKKYSKRLTAEFCISSSLRHPNVIHTLDLLQDAKGDYCEVMEFCAGGDLYTLVLAAGKLEVIEADCYFKQLMRGVEYMHEMGVAHRDLKPENLLLTPHGALKITDFGNGECFRMAWETDSHMVSGLCGSGPYISPEEYIDKEFDARAVDVWATGVIYMAMRTGRHLWRVAKKEDDEFYERYLEGRKDEEGYGPIETLHRVRFLVPQCSCFKTNRD